MSKRANMLPFIKVEGLTDFATIISLIVSMLILAFAINYGDIILSLAALAQVAFTLVGTMIAQTSGTFIKTKETKKGDSRDLTFGLFAVVMLIMIDILVPLTLKVPISSDRLPASLIPSVTFIFLTNQGLPEEKFFRGGLCNVLLKLSNGLPRGFAVPAAALGSALAWAIFHWPAEQGNLINIAAIHNIKSTGLNWKNIQYFNIIHFTITYVNKCRNITSQIKKCMHFHSSFCSSKRCPVKQT